MSTEGSSSSAEIKDSDSKVDEVTQALALVAQGRRNIICGEIPAAVNQFQEACKILATHYGETAKECADAYFYYGQALLELARMETGVLGNALQGVDVEEEEEKLEEKEDVEGPPLTEDERLALRVEVVEAMAEENEDKTKESGDGKSSAKEENGEEKSNVVQKSNVSEDVNIENVIVESGGNKKNDLEDKMETDVVETKLKEDKPILETEDIKLKDKPEEKVASSEHKEVGEKSDKEGETSQEEDTEAEEGEDTAEDEGEVTTDKKEDEEDDADDVPNLQLAWEMLELSKMIYIKEEDKESKLKLAQSYLKLGEVSLETENYEQSVADLKECLTIQEKYLEPTDRLLAETHYQLGLAYGFDKQFDCAIKHYKAAVKVIESKIEQLTKLIEEKATTKGKELATPDDPVSNAAQEIKELKEILPDIVSKVEDSEEEKKNHEELKRLAKEAMGGVFPQSGSSSVEVISTLPKTEVKALDVNLIRRKRKPEEDGTEDGDSKKSKQENGSGDGDSKRSKQENGSGDAKKITENGHSEKKVDDKVKVQSSNVAEPMATS